MDIFLNSNKSKTSVNTSNGLDVQLLGRRKLLPNNDVAEVISQYDQYIEERKNCNIIRLTCQVNPICSNILHNYITEIVKNEGSNDVKLLYYDSHDDTITGTKHKGDDMHWNTFQAIRDTQLTSSDCGYIYHCGRDIFNNHLLRSRTFKTICKTDNDGPEFNTIKDLMRTVEGEQVKETISFPLEAGIPGNKKSDVSLHLYEADDVYSYDECVENRLISKFDGWVGFENKSKIKSYDNFKKSKELPIERPIMYMNGGDFVDMYPDRTLYSFIPKYNSYRKRIEKNWNYCITYPSSSVTEGFESVIETLEGLNSLKTLYFDETTRSDNGSPQLVVYSLAKHGLKEGDFVNIYKKTETTTNIDNIQTTTTAITKILDNAEVQTVVDNFIFVVFSNVAVDEEDKATKVSISYKKVVNDIECDYYVRIFSRLPNFKFASADTSNEYEIYKNDSELIKEYQTLNYDFQNQISRLAFAKNIYTDEIGQVVFTDDIDISNLKDNLGRPLSSIYITFIKNNKGYKEWYSNNINAESVEYSHCFGMVTCGMEMVDDEFVDDDSDKQSRSKIVGEDYKYECIHLMTNKGSDDGMGFDVSKINNRNSAVKLKEVSYYDDVNFYGDLCCYDNYNAIERTIQPILHRFNTAQRECDNDKFSGFTYDEIAADDYDDAKDFTISSITVANCNSMLEGYYYQPHYEIPIKTFDKLETAMPDFIEVMKIEKNDETSSITITALQNHYLSVGDKAVLHDKEDNVYYNCIVVPNSTDNYRRFTCMVYDDSGNNVSASINKNRSSYTMFKMDNLDVPSYARVLKDGTYRIIWRNIVNNGLNESDKTIEEYPFTNGAFYINKRIDIYVRRQDPYGVWGLYDSKDIKGVDVDVENEDNFYKEDEITC